MFRSLPRNDPIYIFLSLSLLATSAAKFSDSESQLNKEITLNENTFSIANEQRTETQGGEGGGKGRGVCISASPCF